MELESEPQHCVKIKHGNWNSRNLIIFLTEGVIRNKSAIRAYNKSGWKLYLKLQLTKASSIDL